MCILKIDDLCVQFHNQMPDDGAVNHLSFEVKSGEVIGITGESGCGKTTTMRAILGLLSNNAQVSIKSMEVMGEEILRDFKSSGKEVPPEIKKLRGKVISMIFQEPAAYLDQAMTIGKQLVPTIREHKKCTKKEARVEAEELLKKAGFENGHLVMKKYPFELSGGMCQRAAIAIALASEPKILIADEPVTALDVTIQKKILELLRKLAKEENLSVIFVSHDLEAAAAVCDRVLIMKDGSMKESGNVDRIFKHPKEEYTKNMLRCAELMKKGKPVKETGKEDLLTLRHVSKSYHVTEAVRDVSFSIYKGESFGLIGESGCGKTTLAKLISGLLKVDEGTICYHGEENFPSGYLRQKKCSNRIRMVFQNPLTSLNPALTVEEMLTETIRTREKNEKLRKMTRGERKNRCLEVLRKVRLDESVLVKYPHEFSGGQRQRLAIARALLGDPDLLICDEAVAALDLLVQKQILDLLKEIQEKDHMTYLFISHDLNAVKYFCHRVGVMYQGRLVDIGKTDEIYRNPGHSYTKELLQ